MKSANQNKPQSQFNLGNMYFKGQGVNKDFVEAKKWYKKSCKNELQVGCDTYKYLELKGY